MGGFVLETPAICFGLGLENKVLVTRTLTDLAAPH